MGGGTNEAVVAAINALADQMKNNKTEVHTTVEIDRRKIGEVINEHFGEAGSSPLRGIG